MYLNIFIFSFIPYVRFISVLINKIKLSFYCNIFLAAVFNLSLIILYISNIISLYSYLCIKIITAIAAYLYWDKALNKKYLLK